MPRNNRVRGIRQTLPSGILIGRTTPGQGPAQQIAISDLASRIATAGITALPSRVNFINKGAWSGTSAYNPGDVVTFNGSAYVCYTAVAAATGGPSPTLDGSVQFQANVGVSSANGALTTTKTNDVICVVATPSKASGTNPVVSSVTATGLTFTKRTSLTSGNGDVELWTAVAASALSAVTITVNFSLSTDGAVVWAFGLNGLNTGTIFDANASVPAISGSGTTATISTNTADDVIVVAYGTQGTPSAPSSSHLTFTQIGTNGAIGNSRGAVYYAIASGTLSSEAISLTNGLHLVDALASTVGVSNTSPDQDDAHWLSQGNINTVDSNFSISSGQLKLASAADSKVVSNISGASAEPVSNGLSAVLDHAFGSSQGSILYRGASSWVVLAPGTANRLLQTNGTAANPTWSGTLTGLTISGGTIDGTTIGGVTKATGSFTNLTVIGTLSLPNGAVTNAMLANSSMTLAGHVVSLGGTQTFAASDLTNGTTGSGAVVLATSPTLNGATLSGTTTLPGGVSGNGTIAAGVIASTGQLGIGTTSPVSSLDVQTTWSSTSPNNLSATWTSYGDPTRFVIRGANGTLASPTGILSGQSVGNINFRGYTSAGTWTVGLVNLQPVAEENYSGTSAATGFSLGTTPTGGTQWLPVFYVSGAGKVLIGNYQTHGVPAYTLDVVGDVNTSTVYRVAGAQIAASNLSNGTTGSGAVVLTTSPTISGDPIISSNYTSIPISADGGEILKLSNSQALTGATFSPTDARVLTFGIDSDKYVYARVGGTGFKISATNTNIFAATSSAVGIGTTAPGYRLDVQGGDINTSGNFYRNGVLDGLKQYTVATLPAAPGQGARAYVTDAVAPTFLGALTGGGTVVTPVFYNGTAWVAG